MAGLMQRFNSMVTHSLAIKPQCVIHSSVTNFIRVTVCSLYSGGVNGCETAKPKMKDVNTALDIGDKWLRKALLSNSV